MLDAIFSLMLIALLVALFVGGFVVGFKVGKAANVTKTALDALRAVFK